MKGMTSYRHGTEYNITRPNGNNQEQINLFYTQTIDMFAAARVVLALQKEHKLPVQTRFDTTRNAVVIPYRESKPWTVDEVVNKLLQRIK